MPLLDKVHTYVIILIKQNKDFCNEKIILRRQLLL